ncbi:MAG: hypothetical protein GXP27_05230, partial [Planctomycetes bacterium]|nr:hypothetical protein [Planctomycetota bacterium]
MRTNPQLPTLRPVLEVLEDRLMLSNIYWDGNSDGDGDNTSWNDPLNWNLDRVPGAADDVVIDAADNPTVVINTNVTIGSLDNREALVLAGGTFTISGPSTTSGSFEWQSGRFQPDGGISNTGTFTVSGGASRDFRGTLENLGTVLHTATGDIRFDSNARIVIRAGATYDHRSSGDFVPNWGTSGNGINNEGTFKHSGSGEAYSSIAFNNLGGTVEIAGSRFSLQNGGTNDGGVYQVNAGGILRYSGGTHSFAGTPRFSGNGTVEVTGGTFSVNSGATVTADMTGSTFRLSGGSIGGAGTVLNLGQAEWTAGRLGTVNASLFRNEGTLTISGNQTRDFRGTFENAGTVIHTATGQIRFYDVSRYNNLAGGLYRHEGTGGSRTRVRGGGTVAGPQRPRFLSTMTEAQSRFWRESSTCGLAERTTVVFT